jgi:formate/nitrite transporter FocA (FNT family)
MMARLNTPGLFGPEAEDEVIAVYRKKVSPLFGIAIVAGIVVCAAVWLYFRRAQYLIATFVAVMFAMLPLLLESRREIIFTSTDFVFDAKAGESGRVPLAQVTDINETSAVHLMGATPVLVPAVQLVLTGGQIRTVPLDYPDRQMILARLRESIADRGRRAAENG